MNSVVLILLAVLGICLRQMLEGCPGGGSRLLLGRGPTPTSADDSVESAVPHANDHCIKAEDKPLNKESHAKYSS